MATEKNSAHQVLPVLPLRDMVVFPNSITPLFVVRPKSLAALDSAIEDGKKIFLVTQKSQEVDDPEPDDLHEIGCIAETLQVLRLPDNSAKVLVEGHTVGRLVDFFAEDAYLKAYVMSASFPIGDESRIEALRRTVLRQFEAHAELSDKIPEDLLRSIQTISDPLTLANSVGNYALFGIDEKQAVLEAGTVSEKLMLLSQVLTRENELLDLEGKILSQVRGQISKSQKEYFLSEQLKIIENELGLAGDEDSELDELRQRVEKSKMPPEAKEKAERELARLSRMAPQSPESTVSRTYVDWLLDMPWGERTKDKLDLQRAQKVLDEDHYGLEKVKERVIEFLAVLQLVKELKGPILCLVGPPGVGKTSLARSVARAVGRKFVRISLGGIRDEAEIRGHRRTYIGSLPGKILQGMKRAGVANPVFLLDEVDKMGMDFRGDPSSALLEVLDPEQNKAFNDHYLEIDYDLSQTMFITTANTTDGIPHALVDRMEVIRLPGYSSVEKRRIAEQFLIPKQIDAHGLGRSKLRIESKTVQALIEDYTREAGVRQLEREIASICRKAARERVGGGANRRLVVTRKKARELLGPPKYRRPRVDLAPEVGVATGLAWTEVGGEILLVETTIMPGKGRLQLTGKLGDVMQESAKAAHSYIRSRAKQFGVPEDFHETTDLHVHIPEGAIPKDGPSAGVALVVSMASALSDKPVRQDAAMTGEITLRGKVLKIGGLKEKVLAAHRAGLRRVILPEENKDDLDDLPKEARGDIEFILAETIEAVLASALASTDSPSKTPRSPRARQKRATTPSLRAPAYGLRHER
jgi:ATP-dependent Lon protease